MKLRAVIYARVSGDQQRRDGTIQTQLASLPRWIEAQGWELICTYTDDGKSASKNIEARGDFARLRADAERKLFDVVVWVDQDRASRTDDWGEFGSIISTFQRNGIKMAEPGVGLIEPGTDAGDMTIFMKWKRASTENRVRRDKTQAGMRRMARDVGGHAFGRIPYGLRWDARVARVIKVRPADGSPHPGWSVDPHEAQVCRDIHRRFLAGESSYEIARDLEKRKEPTKRGGRWFDPVNRILSSPIYRGEARYHGIPVTVPAIIGEDDWFKVQALLSVSQKRGLKQTRREYLGEGLGKCSICASPMYIRATTTRTEGNVSYYVCRDRCDTRLDMSKRCELPRFRTTTIDASIWGEVRAFLSQPRERVIAAIRGHEKATASEAAAWMSDVKRYQEQLDNLDAAMGVFMEQLESRFITTDQFKAHATKSTAKRRMLQEGMEAAEAALGKTGTSRAATEKLEAFLDEYKALVKTADFGERRELLHSLVRKGGLVFDAKGVNVQLVLNESSDKTLASDECSVAAPTVTLRVVA